MTDFFRRFSSENVCFCFTSNENCHFSIGKTVIFFHFLCVCWVLKI